MTTVAIILGMLVLPVFPQDEPPPTSGDTSEISDAIAELMKKAEQGDASAQVNLGSIYYNGQGVPQDYKEALRWYLSAAEQGNATAQFNMGVIYYKGQGVNQGYKEAVRWYRAAAEQGDASAQYGLGSMYYNGQGVPEDNVQAHMWYNLAALDLTGDDKEAAVKNRDSLAENMTSEQIAEAQRLAREWKPKTGSQ